MDNSLMSSLIGLFEFKQMEERFNTCYPEVLLLPLSNNRILQLPCPTVKASLDVESKSFIGFSQLTF